MRANALFGVGAAFDLHAGTVPQAPLWMQRNGLEWAYRLGQEPRRLWRRYLRNNPAFVLKVLTHPPRLARTTPDSSVTDGFGMAHQENSDERDGSAIDFRQTLSIGDVVEVKPAEEILAGLDERGELDALPFMPEMLQFCGRRFVVDKIAFKACDTATWTGLRRLTDAVHLAGVRCDGQAHDGCQAGCLIFWKTAWLTRLSGPIRNRHASTRTACELPVPEQPRLEQRADVRVTASPPGCSGCTRERLTEVAHGECRPRGAGAASDRPVYSCQATELTRAAPSGIPFWDVRQYVQDVRTGNAPVRKVLRGIAIGAFNRMQDLTRSKLPEGLRIRGGRRYPFIEGTTDRRPTEKLDLKPGEWVRVKSIEQISATINADNRNRGLSFDPEMLKYCGRTAQVLRRVDHIIDEASGQMLEMKTPCIVLADVICTADYHRSCPRGVYPYWREIWLERVPASQGASRAVGDRS